MTENKVHVALLSVISNSLLIIMKLTAGLLSGSVSILSEAIHSGMDLLAAIIAFFSVRFSGQPADKDHPFGHGKMENVSGVVEGLLIFVAAGWIIFEAVQKLMNPHEVGMAYLGVVVMAISALVNAWVSSRLYRAAKAYDSVALEADALHLKTDVYTSAGVAVGLLLMQITGIRLLDPLVAIAVALLIVKEAWELVRNAFSPLLDAALPETETLRITEVMKKYEDQIIDYHRLRTRKSGATRHIDFHMTVDETLTVRESHALTEQIEQDMEQALSNTSVNIHIEPGNQKR